VNKLRARALEYSKATPWQKVADSPVTNYYTDWRSLEEVLDRPGRRRWGPRAAGPDSRP